MEQVNSWIILIPIWGEMHIRMCADSVLPALLAHGNLPYISSHKKTIIRFLTTEPSSHSLQNSPICKELSKFATVSYVFIDDLVNLGEYGLTLTMAYERGIQTDPPDLQVKQCYVFFNGDLVPSNNTFVTLHNRISEGYSSVVSPGVRVIEQNIVPILDQIRTNSNGIINCNGKELVGLTLNHLHPTVAAAKVNNSNMGTSISHQYYSQVNDKLLIARFFLLFMLCIKPERPLKMVTSYCDYSFIPELCPSGNYAVITDSDDAFLMELAPLEQESAHIYLGKKDLVADSQRMLSWVTKEHFNYSKYLLYFHTSEIPTAGSELDKLNNAKQELSNALDTIYTVLEKKPRISHEFHPFWNNQINMYKFQGKLTERNSINLKKGFANKILNLCFRNILGQAPFVTKLHYKYQDYSNCINTIKSALSKKENNVLYICGDRKDLFMPFFNSLSNCKISALRIDDINNLNNIDNFNIIFVESNLQSLKKFVKYVASHNISNACKIVLYLDLILAHQNQATIMPYLCLLNDKVAPQRVLSLNANIKLEYYKSSVNFMRELYGKRSIFKMVQYLTSFIISAISITLANIRKTKITSPPPLENISSIVFKF